ncbi:kelch repeat protein-like protein [Plenodomus tracheiphilus IPT5]|uniref:Kelch repeat protein-like protein n=1 Tax=Plenodomus tracheiphilus IPT5 TaxID=1408161 RepID=A0A6A7ATG2_9PLEO|nr:kelch repeat protein-like protein [Plenodomus tracheiphilus IPT5]
MAMERVQPQPAANGEKRRLSVFAEVGLVDEDRLREERSPVRTHGHLLKQLRPAKMLRFRSRNQIINEKQPNDDDESDWESVDGDEDVHKQMAAPAAPLVPAQYTMSTKLYRLGLFSLVLALVLPILSMSPMSRIGVMGSIIPDKVIRTDSESSSLVSREDSPVDVCKRWSGQSTVVNGTLYMYGFRTTTDQKQTDNTWTNDFLSLDLTKSWQVSSPSLTGLPTPSGPPAVSLGQLWSSHNSLWLYGGQYSDSPKTAPGPNSIWEYNIGSKQWFEHKDPKTSAGQNAEGDGQSVQRAAEGAGFSVSTLGRGWYFGGHLDDFTTEGWSNQVARVYLKSLLEFTFPGETNNAVESLQGGKTAGADGVFRNITEGGLQTSGSFPSRADGALVYVPGFGAEGILLGLTGGDNDTFTQMNVIDVYDIANSTWYKQSTAGDLPDYRVNTCTTVAAAADGSSYNVYMYGGQNLQPAQAQTQKSDMWILSVPSFTWIKVDQGTSQQTAPPARAGHQCHVWDGQLIVVGGYVGQEISCDAPGIYVFNMTSLSWSNQFTALTGDRATQSYSDKGSTGNPLAQQANQRGFGVGAGLEGSYGYAVPDAVQKVVGGAATGGATLTAPVQTATRGPLATGKPQTYTLTGPDGATITQIVDGPNSSSPKGSSGPNIGAIVAGVIAGVFFVVAAYFAFCAWIYRKQVQIWKNHAAVVTTRAQAEKQNAFTASSTKNSSERAARTTLGGGSSHGAAAGSFDVQRLPSVENGGGAATTAYGGAGATQWDRRSSVGSVTEDLLDGSEPSFWGTRGVLLNPRRSLRVINRD